MDKEPLGADSRQLQAEQLRLMADNVEIQY